MESQDQGKIFQAEQSTNLRHYLFYDDLTNCFYELNDTTICQFKDAFVSMYISFDDMKARWLNQLNNFSRFASFVQFRKYFESGDFSTKNIVALVKLLYSNLKDGKPAVPHMSIMGINETVLELTYSNLSKIVDNLLYALSFFITSWGSTGKVTDVLEGKKDWSDFCCKDRNIVNFFENLKTAKIIKIIIANAFGRINDVFINLDRVLLFCLFYDIIFPFALEVQFDLNIPQLNKLYLKQRPKLYRDPLPVINMISNSFMKFFISNFLLTQTIAKSLAKGKELRLSVNQLDSYIIEIANVLLKEIGLDFQPRDRANYNIFFYSNLFDFNELSEFTMNINSLDNILFRNTMFIFFQNLNLNTVIMKVNINLFPKELNGPINFRKIYINNVYYKDLQINQIPKNAFEKGINFKYNNDFNWYNKDTKKFISDDKIIDLLYNEFRDNLVQLVVLLESNLQCTHLNISLNLPNCLKRKMSYIYSIAFFIFNVFRMLERKSLMIKMNYLKIVSDVEIPGFIFNQMKANLSKLRVQNLVLKINKLSQLIDFSTLPYCKFDYLKFAKFSYNDLQEFNNGIKQSVHLITNLNRISIKMNCELYINYNEILNFFKDSIPSSLNTIKFKIPNELSYEDFINISSSIITGLAYAEHAKNRLVVNVYLDIDDNEKQLYSYYNVIEIIRECLRYDKLIPGTILSYTIDRMQKRTETKQGLISLTLTKGRRIKDQDDIEYQWAQLITQLYPLPVDYSFQVSSTIISYLIRPVSRVQINFVFRCNK